MVSIARPMGASVTQLALSLRNSVTLGTSRRTALLYPQVGSSSRTFRTSTVSLLAPSSSRAISDTTASTEGSSDAEIAEKKPKRRRRSKEEIEAALLAKSAFGVPIRSQKRTRRAIGNTAAAYAERDVQQHQEQEQEKPPERRGRPKIRAEDTGRLARKESRLAALALAQAQADEPLSAEVMEKLLENMQYEHMPPRDEWKNAFPTSKQFQTSYRYFVSNRSTIKDIISALGITDPERNGEKVTVIEGYPGPGTFATELLQMEQVEKVIALEDTPRYVQKLEELQTLLESKQPGQGARLDVLESSAYLWDTYNQLVSSGKLAHLNNRVTTSDGQMVDFTSNSFVSPDHSDASWQKLSPMIFFAQLPNTVYGEQLFAQIVTAIASRIWLFRQGRVQLGFVCGESLAKRCLAEAGDKISRGKLGTTVQCLADVEVHKYAHELAPHTHHFFPPTMSVGPRVTVSGTSLIPNSNPSTGLTRTGMVMLTVTPKKKPLVKANEIEAFEFITRNLFILRNKPVGEALTHVAPGGQNVLKMTSPAQADKGLIREDEVILPEQIVSDLTNVQWACLARMFEKWPFRPVHLFEEGRIKPDNKGRN
ncbi:related to MTF1-mitochondrial RNA polymerase specificity factor [Sporisorium reilianum f. sp. reilianum]|uniref:rRNA adenine N(6)-methyltransferase n=1 Tax=Sporisorium reilianum f. sp. reilianum TaxID=72559 RepID=A0A2N8UFQ6_9BASI|nr:related to MTF1-mitochondrial RNA polymerase specificity factor [Sporisorium reilianum f. sp. reilianum]